jgi:hypothetical protein
LGPEHYDGSYSAPFVIHNYVLRSRDDSPGTFACIDPIVAAYALLFDSQGSFCDRLDLSYNAPFSWCSFLLVGIVSLNNTSAASLNRDYSESCLHNEGR